MTEICFVCSRELPIHALRQHVNRCLDQRQEEASIALARQLSTEPDAQDCHTTGGTSLTRAKRPTSPFSHCREDEDVYVVEPSPSAAAHEPKTKRKKQRSACITSSCSSTSAHPTVTALPQSTTPASAIMTFAPPPPTPLAMEDCHGGLEVMDKLFQACQRSAKENKSALVRYIVCGNVSHYSQTGRGRSYTCGFRNIQMMTSHLLRQPSYARRLFNGCGFVPSLNSLQRELERAWRCGFDQEGALHFDYKVSGTDRWIGSSDVSLLLAETSWRAARTSSCLFVL